MACGSTGEFTALSSDERRLVVETVVDQTARRVPVIAQTGATSTAEAIRLSRHAQAVGADVIMPVAPYYEPLSVDETLTYLRAVAGSVDIPVMLYNLPMATGVDLTRTPWARWPARSRTSATSRTRRSTWPSRPQLIHNHGDVISTFVGWDSLLLSALAEGAAGVMAGTANVVPSELVAVYDAVSAGDLEGARKTWAQIYPLIEAIMAQPFIAAVKAGLAAVGFPVGAPRPPVAALDPGAAARIAQLAKTTTMEATMGTASTTEKPAVRRVRAPGSLLQDGRPSPRSALHRRSLPAGPVRHVHRRRRPQLRAHDRPGRRGHGRGHRRRGGGRVRREGRVGSADAQGALRGAAPGRRPGRRERRPPRPAGVGQHRQAVRGRAGRRGPDHRHVPLHGRGAAGAHLRGRGPLRRGPPVGHPARAAGRHGVVTPWNYPLLMAAWKMAPILAAGNTLVIKPSEQTPLTTLKFAELVADILPAGVLNVVTGYGPVVGARLAEHPDIAMIALTGSVRAARRWPAPRPSRSSASTWSWAARPRWSSSSDADLAAAATALRAAGYWNSGQECGAACRVLVHESVADEFAQLLVDEVATMVVGEPGAGDDVEIGPLTSKAHFDRVTGYLKRAEAEGLRGHRRRGARGRRLLRRTDGPGRRAGRRGVRPEEIFGPAVTVETFTDEDEVVPAPTCPLRPVGLGLDQGRPAQPRRRLGWTPARSGSTPTWCWRTRFRGAASRGGPGYGSRPVPSTRSTTTRGPSTSCTTWRADRVRLPRGAACRIAHARVARTVERTSSENRRRCCSAAIRAASASPRTMASTTARWLRMCLVRASCSRRQKFQMRRARLAYWLRVDLEELVAGRRRRSPGAPARRVRCGRRARDCRAPGRRAAPAVPRARPPSPARRPAPPRSPRAPPGSR